MRINQPIKYFLVLSSILLSACATGPTGTTNTLPEPREGVEQSTSENQPDSLSRDLIYNTLTSEIAAQRGQNSLAFEHALQAARESRDESAAERATGLGLQANRPDSALTAAKLWVDISPSSLKAHQIAAILYIRKKNLSDAIQHLQQVVEIANSKGQSGHLQAAAIAEKSGAPDQALIIMQQLVEEESSDPKALYALALTANHAKQRDLALDYINQSLSLNPKSTQSLVLKTHTLIAMGKQSEGLAFMKQAVDDSPDNVQLGKAYARTLLELNQPEAALDTFEKLQTLAPDDDDIVFSLGIIHLQLEQLEQAKSHLEKLVDKRQKRNEANYYLGMIAEEEDEPEKALAWYSQVEGKNLADAQVRIAKILADQGNLNQARETLQRLRINQSHNQVKFYIIEAELLREALQFEAAHKVYSKALDLFQDNTDLLYARGLNAADLKRVDLLEKDLRKILAAQPKHADALNALGYTLADQTDRLEEAKQYIQQALSLKPDSPAILDSMGWVEYRMGNLESALEFLNKAAELSPDAEIASHLGEVLWQMGQQQRALKVWKAANQREPNNRFINQVMSRLGADI
ncbi:MAG: tetratricopeptide repeat protein [Candidatus Thiodiazotropha sp. (ex Lucinoma borealis)]|nr:tetratricopeptide repeat protein [Candidatus Thiodiazotropha sp. (ex Lucinoma borealis)]MCU7869546.1 tetratricopeptide repeat protein [Candidatus Thiodiazotropha sp. (ex Lucinoma borealis)]